MDSALCLHYGALRIPSTINCAASISNFRPSSLSLSSKASTYRAVSQHAFSNPVICALNKPSTPPSNFDKDNGKKIVRVVGGASVVLACILGIIRCNSNFTPRALAGYQRDTTANYYTPQEVLTEPKHVLASLLTHLPKPKSPGWTMMHLKKIPKLDLPERPGPEDLNRLKIGVAQLIKSGMYDEADKQLRILMNAGKGSIPANEAEMELVLVLICQGNYQKALECNCLNASEIPGFPSDGRVQLYKAIIHTMLDHDTDAKKCWDAFLSPLSGPIKDMTSGNFYSSEDLRSPPRKKR